MSAPSPRSGSRVLALAQLRVRAAVRGRALPGPLVALVAVQLVGLAGGRAPAAVCLVTAVAFALPVLTWAARQVLDAEPDEQVRMSTLAVGGPVRSALAGLLAAYAVVAPLALLCAAASLVHAGEAGTRAADLLVGLALAAATALACVAVGAAASRAVAGPGVDSVLVLVAAPVLTAVLGLSRSPVLAALVPPLGAAVRSAYDGRFAGAVPALAARTALWSAVVLAVRLLLRRG